ncbi:hypothetical protein Pelo_16747 [Pelomyxa schiedti]|nr:hypothetical protein Pelo_16747 [Pelomyxa schiedti]
MGDDDEGSENEDEIPLSSSDEDVIPEDPREEEDCHETLPAYPTIVSAATAPTTTTSPPTAAASVVSSSDGNSATTPAWRTTITTTVGTRTTRRAADRIVAGCFAEFVDGGGRGRAAVLQGFEKAAALALGGGDGAGIGGPHVGGTSGIVGRTRCEEGDKGSRDRTDCVICSNVCRYDPINLVLKERRCRSILSAVLGHEPITITSAPIEIGISCCGLGVTVPAGYMLCLAFQDAFDLSRNPETALLGLGFMAQVYELLGNASKGITLRKQLRKAGIKSPPPTPFNLTNSSDYSVSVDIEADCPQIRKTEIIASMQLYTQLPLSSFRSQKYMNDITVNERWSQLLTTGKQVTIKMTEDMGRGLFAACDIPCGSVILMETPAASVPFLKGMCAHCMRTICSPCVCAKCGEAYCSETCRSEARHKYHQAMCHCSKHLSKLQEAMSNQDIGTCPLVMLVARIIAMILSSDEWKNGLVPSTLEFGFLHHLSCHPLPRIVCLDPYWNSYLALREAFSLEFLDAFNFQWYVQLMSILEVNTIGIMGGAAGHALYNTVSFINHSCTPNSQCAFNVEKEGDLILIVAQEDIPQGTEVGFMLVPHKQLLII